jgi:hypothetical protein
MKTYAKVSRKTVGEDRIAICPQFGCINVTRVKPLKLGFLGFSKYPKCKKHQIPLVYIDERIGDFVDAALACLFDLAGFPPKKLLSLVNKEVPEDLEIFVSTWVYCITIGRGSPIISQYMDSISNTYLKQLTKKQIRVLSYDDQSKKNNVYQAISKGIQEITNQYTRLLKHLRTHNEVFTNIYEPKPLSNKLRKVLFSWLEMSKQVEKDLLSIEEKRVIPLSETKKYYDSILNMGTCKCLLGLSSEKMMSKTKRITAFDRFSAYFDFFSNGLTKNFTKSDIEELLSNCLPETSINQPTRARDNGVGELTNGMIYRKNDIRQYSVKDFFFDIKKEIRSLVKKEVNYRRLSTEFLGYVNNYHIQSRINSAKRSSSYTLVNRLLTRYYNKMKINLQKQYSISEERLVKIKEIIQKYKELNSGVHQNEFDLIISYFEKIDTVEKAYWLGWIFAEGHISVLNKATGEFKVTIGVEDGILIKRFVKAIGFDPRAVEYGKKLTKTGKISRFFTVKITDSAFISNLVKNGVPTGRKSWNLRMPSLSNNPFDLAFIMGYFDGDGHRADSPSIASSSRKFLEDIRALYSELNSKKIAPHRMNGKITGYYMILPTRFFNELLENLDHHGVKSLPRKAIRYLTSSENKAVHTAAIKRYFRGKAEERRLRVIELRLQGWTDWKTIFIEGLGLTWVSHNRAREYLRNWFALDPAVMGKISHFPDEDIYVLVEEVYKPGSSVSDHL